MFQSVSSTQGRLGALPLHPPNLETEVSWLCQNNAFADVVGFIRRVSTSYMYLQENRETVKAKHFTVFS